MASSSSSAPSEEPPPSPASKDEWTHPHNGGQRGGGAGESSTCTSNERRHRPRQCLHAPPLDNNNSGSPNPSDGDVDEEEYHDNENLHQKLSPKKLPTAASLTSDSSSGSAYRFHSMQHLTLNSLNITQQPQQPASSSSSPTTTTYVEMEAAESVSETRSGSSDGLFASLSSTIIPNQDETTTSASPQANNNELASNERLLATAFFSFMSFALVQSVFAFVANSQAMMGDSAAMIVDALTYLFNWIAERRKNRLDNNDITYSGSTELMLANNSNRSRSSSPMNNADSVNPERFRKIRERTKRKMVLQLEIVPPIISVATLLIVIAFVLRRAVRILLLDMHRNASQQGNPNINLMLAFSVFNLALDGLNMFCFAKSNHLFGYETEEHHRDKHGETSTTCVTDEEENRSNNHHHREMNGHENGHLPEQQGSATIAMTMNGSCPSEENTRNGGHDRMDNNSTAVKGMFRANKDKKGVAMPCPTESFDERDGADDDDDDPETRTNLNMCSAYSHVFADTLRSIAVIVAAVIAKIVPRVTPEEADATAALVVSMLILMSLVPLFQGILTSISELKAIRAEERSEKMFPNQGILNQTTLPTIS